MNLVVFENTGRASGLAIVVAGLLGAAGCDSGGSDNDNANPPGNAAPVAQDDTFTVKNGDALTVAAPGVLGNDSDPQNEPLTAVLVTGPSNGAFTLSADGSFEYTHDGSAINADSFVYKASDGANESSSATVTIAIGAGAPVAADACENTALDAPKSGTVSVTNPGGVPLIFSIASPGTKGTADIDQNTGEYTYTPNTDARGVDRFTYQVDNGSGGTDIGEVTIIIDDVRIMPLGDSITEGVEDGDNGNTPESLPPNESKVSYRQKLFIDLESGGYSIDFVGSQNRGGSVAPAFDPDNEGYSGAETGHFVTGTGESGAPTITAALTNNRPDMVLLHIGTNDVTRAPGDLTTATNNVLSILDAINTWAGANKPVTVLLARIINMVDVNDGTTNRLVNNFNDMVQNEVSARVFDNISIVIVNQHDALNYAGNPGDLDHDNPAGTSPWRKHPGSITNGVSTGGYEKMADAWFNVMTLPAQAEVLPKCP